MKRASALFHTRVAKEPLTACLRHAFHTPLRLLRYAIFRAAAIFVDCFAADDIAIATLFADIIAAAMFAALRSMLRRVVAAARFSLTRHCRY